MKEKTLQVFERLETQRKDVIASYNRFSDKQLQFSPEPGHWNMLQVLRHLVTAEKQSVLYINRKIKSHENVKRSGISSSVRHFILKIALMMPLKFKAPKVVEVHEDYPDFEAMIDEWEEIHSELKFMIENSDENILSKTLYKHPRAGMLNFKQALEFLETHINHHRKQMNRIVKHTIFPVN